MSESKYSAETLKQVLSLLKEFQFTKAHQEYSKDQRLIFFTFREWVYNMLQSSKTPEPKEVSKNE
jgi:dihydrofolate reductase